MPFITPRTWAGGNLASSDLNTDVRDNIVDLDARMLLHGLSSSAVVGQLRSARYGVSLTKSSQSAGDATDVAMFFDTEEWDDWSGHSTVTNTHLVTILTDGTYDVKALASFESNATGRREVWIEKNGSAEYNRVRVPAVSGVATSIVTACDMALVAGDTIAERVRQNSGGALNVTARLSVRRVSI